MQKIATMTFRTEFVVRTAMSKRTEYHREYYQRTAERRRKLAREGAKRRRWHRWARSL
jgi:hypothetical protein